MGFFDSLGDILHYFDVKLYRKIVVVRQTEKREIQELLICSLSFALDDLDNIYFYPNISKLKEKAKLLTKKPNIVILKKTIS